MADSIKGKKFRVNLETEDGDGYAGRKYGGMVGIMRFHSTTESLDTTGWPYSLEFSEEDLPYHTYRTDGFITDEVTPLD